MFASTRAKFFIRNSFIRIPKTRTVWIIDVDHNVSAVIERFQSAQVGQHVMVRGAHGIFYWSSVQMFSALALPRFQNLNFGPHIMALEPGDSLYSGVQNGISVPSGSVKLFHSHGVNVETMITTGSFQ